MKKFILIVLVVVLSKLSFAYAYNSNGIFIEEPGATSDGFVGTKTTFIDPIGMKHRLTITRNTIPTNRLKNLAGKTIYREVPVQNETEFSKEYMDEPYELFSYNENIMELKNSDKESITLRRSLWDDGNWKEYLKNNAIHITPCYTNHSCSYIYNSKYNLSEGDHVVWGEKCGHILVFDMNDATVAYCREKSSPYYCSARDEVYIGANNLFKTYKCFKDSSNESEKYNTKTINKWYEGQEVWDVLKGRGVVVFTSVTERNSTTVWINVKFDTNLFKDWKDIDTYTFSGKYQNNQAQRLYPIETKKVLFDLDKLFPKK